jgi:transposase InsO family protein
MTSLDLSSAYLQIPLHKDSRKYTAFLFDSTIYQFKRTPYGFKNSLSAFVRALKLALGGGTESFVVFYIDDILIHSRTFGEHLKHLDTVIGRLTRAGFTLNAAKCHFCKGEVQFLGHRIDKYGITADPDRIAATLEYPAPRNSKQLRQFLGTCNFHSRFIVGYANYTAPLLPLLQQGNKWEWTQEKQDAFLRLRESFARSIQLVHPREGIPYAIYTDASKLGVSSVLTQESSSGETLIVSTASRVLSPTERRYSTCEQELLAVVYALQKFRIYVTGHPVTVYSDNKALSFLGRCNLVSNRVTRWIMQLQEFDLSIVHISGANNFFADTLSRHPTGLTKENLELVRNPREIFVAKINLDIDKTLKKELDDLSKHQYDDPSLVETFTNLREDPFAYKNRYMIRNGVLYRKDDRAHPYWRAILPKTLEYRVIKYVHTLLGHHGTDKCMYHISQSFYLKNLSRRVRKFVSQCDVCQRVKHPNRAYEIASASHLPTRPGELMTLDLYGPLPTGRGGVKHLLVCLDVFSKHVTLYPLKSATTRSCLNKLKTHYFPKVTKPTTILSDHGSQFSSPSWRKALSELGIQAIYSPIRHPESNPTERVMRELGRYFRIYCHETQKKWPELVPHIETWLNSSVSGTTGYAPIELLNGEPRPHMFDKILKKETDQCPTEETLAEKLIKAYARSKLKAENRRRKRQTGTRKWQPSLGELVLVKRQPISDAAQGITGKFQRPFEGPYTIKKMVPPAMYELCGQNGKLRGLFHLKHLKSYTIPIQEHW